MVEGGGFEPPKAEPTDLQSAPFDRSGTPPKSGQSLVRRARSNHSTDTLSARPNGARRGTRTHDLLIHTRYRFHGPAVRPATTLASTTGLESGLSLHHTGLPTDQALLQVGGVKSLHFPETSTPSGTVSSSLRGSTGLPFASCNRPNRPL